MTHTCTYAHRTWTLQFADAAQTLAVSVAIVCMPSGAVKPLLAYCVDEPSQLKSGTAFLASFEGKRDS